MTCLSLVNSCKPLINSILEGPSNFSKGASIINGKSIPFIECKAIIKDNANKFSVPSDKSPGITVRPAFSTIFTSY